MSQLYTLETEGRTITPENALFTFYKDMAAKCTELHKDILGFFLTSLFERGWFPDVAKLEQKFEEIDKKKLDEAIDELAKMRLLAKDPLKPGAFQTFLHGLTPRKTPYYIVLENEAKVQFYASDPLGALMINGLSEIPCKLICRDEKMGLDIMLRLADGALDSAKPEGIGVYIEGWDGKAPLQSTVFPKSRFFQTSEELDTFSETPQAAQGMSLGWEMIIMVGMGMAGELAEVFKTVAPQPDFS